jgi:hypothetical protein
MIKTFTLLNVIGLFFLDLFLGAPVSLDQDLPARMDPGSEVRVTVTVNKDQITGFAKLQIDLPTGLSATAIETKGASFTFADGKAKFIWMALPAQPTFKVSYTLSADASASGVLPVTGRLSYIEDNERKTVDLPARTVTVGSGEAVASAPQSPAASNTTVNSPETTASMEQAPPPAAAATTQPGIAAQAGPGDVSASRTISTTSTTEVLVTVTIKKGLLRGFGKLQETLPDGFTAVAKETDDAIFSAEGKIVKFVWLNLPSKNELTVSYRVFAPNAAEGEYTINGEFGYLLNDLTQRAIVGSSTFHAGQAALADMTPKATEANPVTTTATTQANTTAENPATATEQPANTNNAPAETTAATTRPRVTSVPAPESGITFKVQITAAHREVGKPYFVQRHHYNGDFSIEHNDGWIKYVTGLFDQYKAARAQRQSYIDANYNFPGPFVTAYNNGERITVQEALMISKQRSAQ